MAETTYISAVQAISWIAFKDFDAMVNYLPEYYGTRGMVEYGIQDINRGNNKVIHNTIEGAISEFLELLRAKKIDLWGCQKSGPGPYDQISLTYLLHDNLKFSLTTNELWFIQKLFTLKSDEPDWEKLKVEKQKILKFWPKNGSIPELRTTKKHGRKSGSSPIKKMDEVHVLKMYNLILSGKVVGVHAAAVQVGPDVKHSSLIEPESVTKRLMLRYKEMFPDNSEK